MPVHMRDSDCIVNLATDTCIVCKVYHGEPCPVCNHRAYHAHYCPMQDSDCEKCGHYKQDCKSGDMYLAVIPSVESACQNFVTIM